jgi:hypothetical protein
MTKRFFLCGKGQGYVLMENIGGSPMLANHSRGITARSKKLSVLLQSILMLDKIIPHDSVRIAYSPHPDLVGKKGYRPLNEKEKQQADAAFVS